MSSLTPPAAPRDWPPLTGGRNATSSPLASGARHSANSWLTEATTDGRYLTSSGKRLPYRANRSSTREPSDISALSSARPTISFSLPKKRTRTRIAAIVAFRGRHFHRGGNQPVILNRRLSRCGQRALAGGTACFNVPLKPAEILDVPFGSKKTPPPATELFLDLRRPSP